MNNINIGNLVVWVSARFHCITVCVVMYAHCLTMLFCHYACIFGHKFLILLLLVFFAFCQFNFQWEIPLFPRGWTHGVGTAGTAFYERGVFQCYFWSPFCANVPYTIGFVSVFSAWIRKKSTDCRCVQTLINFLSYYSNRKHVIQPPKTSQSIQILSEYELLGNQNRQWSCVFNYNLRILLPFLRLFIFHCTAFFYPSNCKKIINSMCAARVCLCIRA